MNKSGLIDMFGLSGNSQEHDPLDELFLRLQSEISPAQRRRSASDISVAFTIMVHTPIFDVDDVMLHVK